MSDSARTDHASEIDKLVSSVRKLVSSDLKQTTSVRGMSCTVTSEADRLLLTPSFRVDDSRAGDRHGADATAGEASNVLVLHVGPRKDAPSAQAADPDRATDRVISDTADTQTAMTAQPDDWEAGKGAADQGEAGESGVSDAEAPLQDADVQADVERDTDLPLGDDFADADDAGAGHVDDLVDDIAARIDPEALRALVAQLLREELQGDLGERMTRSVRKLVRREINRAILSRELD